MPTTLERQRTAESPTASVEAWTSLPATVAEVEITPGHHVRIPIPDEEPARHYYAHLIRHGDGSWSVESISQDATVRMTHDMPKRLGLDIPRTTFYRMLRAQLIASYRVTPTRTLISLNSLLRFLRAVRVDPERPTYWTRERRLALDAAYGSLNGPAED